MALTTPCTPESLGHTTLTTPDDTSIVMTRSFEALRERVFDLWTDPTHIPQFWGPARNTVEIMGWDFRPNGEWSVVSTLADGGSVRFHGIFTRIERPHLVEWTFGFNDTPPSPEALFLDERDGITTMRSLQVFPTRDIRDMVLGTGMETGAAEMHDRFAQLLENE